MSSAIFTLISPRRCSPRSHPWRLARALGKASWAWEPLFSPNAKISFAARSRIPFLDVAFVTRRCLRFGRLWSKFDAFHSTHLLFSLLLLFSFALQFLAALAPYLLIVTLLPLVGLLASRRRSGMCLCCPPWVGIPCTQVTAQEASDTLASRRN